LASSIDKAPSGDRWVHEIKFDGYRVQVHLANNEVKVFNRRGHDWTNRFKKIASDAWHISAGSAIIDGEVVAPAADGTTDFSVLQNELKGRSTKIVMVAFDLLYLNGHDLRKMPLAARNALLKKLIDKTDIQFSESFDVGGEMFKHACKTGLEGVVSNVRDSLYPSGRTKSWLKVTCAQRETLSIAGFAMDGNKRDGLYVGRRNGNDLVYAGKVDHGFDRESAKALRGRLTPLIARPRITHSDIWVEPKLFAEVEYRATCGTRSSRASGRRSNLSPRSTAKGIYCLFTCFGCFGTTRVLLVVIPCVPIDAELGLLMLLSGLAPISCFP
jgi:bifunctional non-homologous end joining protein LigD